MAEVTVESLVVGLVFVMVPIAVLVEVMAKLLVEMLAGALVEVGHILTSILGLLCEVKDSISRGNVVAK